VLTVNRILLSTQSRFNTIPPPRWELTLISHLLIAVSVRDARISRLEELDHQKAVALDEQRRRGERLAARIDQLEQQLAMPESRRAA